MNDDELARDRRPPARGFSTRAIRAASRTPRVDQRPSSLPIYQTAAFASADAQELGDVAADPRAGYAYTRISNPTSSALGAAYAELASGEAAVAFASGMGTINAALASQLKAGDRVVAPLVAYGSTRTQLGDSFARFGVIVDFADLTDKAAAAAAIAAGPPPSTSQRQMSEGELAGAGITPGLLRISVGLEDLEDLQDDFAAALAAARNATGAVEQPAVGV